LKKVPDFLDLLAEDARKTIKEGYYELYSSPNLRKKSLRGAIERCENAAIIAEMKKASPSMGAIRKNIDPLKVSSDIREGGAVAISVLTEPKHFGGSIDLISIVSPNAGIPVLMKDIVISHEQIDSAARNGADAVLLIQSLFDRGYCEGEIGEFIKNCHSKKVEVLLEVHDEEEFLRAKKTNADMIGINNRDLRTLKVDLDTTKRILTKYASEDMIIVSESGIRTPGDILTLREYGVNAFLVGTSIMKSPDVEKKVKELVETF
jgi:indole-3-glycerol phosphate synthase